jgi:Protein of unknown function (DUF2815)
MAEKRDDSLVCITPPGTACFCHIWEPHAFKPAKGSTSAKEPQYRIILVFDEDTDLSELKKTAGRAAIKKWGVKASKEMVADEEMHLPFRKGREYREYGEPFTDPGAVFISASSNGAPGVVDARAKPIMKQQDFYAGCKARISVYAHAYDSMGNKGVTFLLNNVQKTGDGKRISGRADAEEEFDAVDSDADADDLF